MPKYSVKKPITVLVAVIMVLVLGVVSFSKMTPTLFPSLDFPYVVLVTTYPGATPEKVESTVTKPLEQAMATLENIQSIESTSASNYSMLTLKFTEDADLDALMVDILQKINTVEGSWDDTVGTPSIMKINPDMIPVMVAAVDMDGMDTAELSAFMNTTVLNKLEGTAGVASISSSGLLTQTIEVTLSEQKIDAFNQKLIGEIDKAMQEAADKLDEAQSELDSAQEEIADGQAALSDGKTQLADQTADAQAQLNEKQAELLEAKSQLSLQIVTLQQQLTELESSAAQLTQLQEMLQSLTDAREQTAQELAVLQALEDDSEALLAKQLAFEAEIAAIYADSSLTASEKQAAADAVRARDDYKQYEADEAALEAKLTARGLTREQLPLRLAASSAALSASNAALDALDAALGEMGMSREDMANALEEIEAGKAQLQAAIVAMQQTLDGLSSGQAQLSDALAALEAQKTAAIFQLSDTTAQLLQGQAALDSASAQLESGLDALEEQKQSAYDSADLHTILTISTVGKLLVAQNFSMPAGYAYEDGTAYLVSVGDSIDSLDALESTVLLDLQMDGIEPITLADIADITVTDNSNELYARINGADGVLLSFSKQSTYATATVSKNLATKFDELSESYPGLHFTPLMDQGDYIYLIVDSVLENLFFSALLAVLILFLFLKDIKPTIMTLCSIPLSLLLAIVLMYFSGVTLNMISLSGLAVSVGMLVDNSIVVIENIYRLRHKGYSPIQAAVSGAAQVTGAIAASTLTTICVFAPIVFVEGLTRQLFTDMALTITYALLASLLIALTLVPAMASRLLKNTKERSHRLFEKVVGGYRRSLAWALRRKPLVLLLALALLVSSVLLAFSRGFSFMPDMSSSQLTVSLETSEDTPLADTKAVADEAVQRIMEIDGVTTVGAMMSGGTSVLTALSGSSTAVTLYVQLDTSRSVKSTTVAAAIEEACADLNADISASSSGMSLSLLTGSGVSVQLYGNDLDELQNTAIRLADTLSQVEGLQNVSDGIDETNPALHFTVDKEKAMQYGLTVAQVYQQVAAALQTSSTATSVSLDNADFDVVISSGENSTVTPDAIKELTFSVTDQNGDTNQVALKDIATVEETETMCAIQRLDQRRYLTVSAEVADGYTVTGVTAAAKAALADFSLPDGMSLEFDGENESTMEAVAQLLQMLLLGVLLVYLIMAAQFQSLKSPLIIMFTIPLAFTGGLLALFLTGKDVSVISLIGFVMLVGIIVNNGIVLVDYINQLRRDGIPKREALIEAGATRLRPILMTASTTILGLLTMALGIGTGTDLMQPIATVCIGGLLYATLLTLYVIPVIYDLFHRKELTVIDEHELEIVKE